MTNSDPALLICLPQQFDSVDGGLFPAKDFREIVKCSLRDDIWTARACALNEEPVEFLLYLGTRPT
jgi:hypothetical protein